MRGQTRKMSLVETILSTAIGYGIAVGTQALVFPLFGLYTSWGDDLGIAAIFTVVSLLRGYAIRRFFNFLHSRGF